MSFVVQCWRNTVWVNRVKVSCFWLPGGVFIRKANLMMILEDKFEN